MTKKRAAKTTTTNRQDTTVRNLRVTRRDVAELCSRVTWLEQALGTIGQALRAHGR